MSRYIVTTAQGERTDYQSVLGFDPPLRTFFLQAFMEDEGDTAVWLGTCLEEYPTLEDLVAAERAQSCESATSARTRSSPCWRKRASRGRQAGASATA